MKLVSDISLRCHWLKLTSSLIVSRIWFFTNQFRKPDRTFGQWGILAVLESHQILSWLISTLSFRRPMLHFWWILLFLFEDPCYISDGEFSDDEILQDLRKRRKLIENKLKYDLRKFSVQNLNSLLSRLFTLRVNRTMKVYFFL